MFLHPDTGEEYALARTERKTSPGYHGFDFDTSPTVTIEDDLSRRDLTINALAVDEGGATIDPFGGRDDIDNRRVSCATCPALLSKTRFESSASPGSLQGFPISVFGSRRRRAT